MHFMLNKIDIKVCRIEEKLYHRISIAALNCETEQSASYPP